MYSDEFDEKNEEETKGFKSIEPMNDEFETHMVADNINGIGIGSYMSKYLS